MMILTRISHKEGDFILHNFFVIFLISKCIYFSKRIKRPIHQPNDDESSSFVEDYADSNSNSRLSSSFQDDCSTSNDSFIEYYSKKRKLANNNQNNNNHSNHSNGYNNNGSGFNNNNNNNVLNNNQVQVNSANGASGSDYPFNVVSNLMIAGVSGEGGSFETPLKKFKNSAGTPDSGVSLAAGSSSSPPMNGGGESSNHFDIMKKVDRVKKNYRKHLNEDSDST